MFGLLLSLAGLGLVSIDPVGIAAMPVLLTQKRPLARSFIFLGGSFAALMAVGLLLALGFGVVVLRFENSHKWLVPGSETLAGLVLLSIGAGLIWHVKTGRASTEPPQSIVKRLRLGNIQLFMLGAVIVTIQSVADVVFVIAMIRAGQLNLSVFGVTAVVGAYAIAALALQLSVVMAYRIARPEHRTRILSKVHSLLADYSNQALICISLVLGCGLLGAGLLGFGR
jgi:hypothetical protein